MMKQCDAATTTDAQITTQTTTGTGTITDDKRTW